jgi:hypothetical protein
MVLARTIFGHEGSVQTKGVQMAPNKAVDLTKLFKGVPAGAWVAISSGYDRVVAYAYDVQTALTEAKRLGEKEPVVMRVPEASTALVL